MHINDQAIIATSYIAKDGDEKNKCFLSQETLFIRYKGRLEFFDLSAITGIQFKHKMLLLPIVLGGIITPFCLLALLKTFGNPWLVLSGLVIGLLMIYYGYDGTPTLSISTKVKEFDFFIKKPTPNLFAFAKYTRQIFTFGEKGFLFYLKLTESEQAQLSNGSIHFDNPSPLLYYEEVLKSKTGDQPFFAIDPLKVANNFKLDLVNNKVVPQLTGKVSGEYILQLNS